MLIWACLNIWIDQMDQIQPTSYCTQQPRGAFTDVANTDFNQDLKLATFQLHLTTFQQLRFTTTHHSPRTSSHCSVYSLGADPSLAALTDVFKDTGCRGINLLKSPIWTAHFSQSQVDQIAVGKPPNCQVAGSDFMLRLRLITASSDLDSFLSFHFLRKIQSVKLNCKQEGEQGVKCVKLVPENKISTCFPSKLSCIVLFSSCPPTQR